MKVVFYSIGQIPVFYYINKTFKIRFLKKDGMLAKFIPLTSVSRKVLIVALVCKFKCKKV